MLKSLLNLRKIPATPESPDEHRAIVSSFDEPTGSSLSDNNISVSPLINPGDSEVLRKSSLVKEQHAPITITKKQLFVAIYVVLSIIPGIFLLNSTLLSGEEVLFTGNLSRLLDHFSLWSQSNFGASSGTKLWILFPLGTFYYILHGLIGIGTHYVQFAYVFACFMIGLSSAAYFLKSLHMKPYSFPGLLAVVFYMYNIYCARILGGPFQFLLPYALTPLFLGLFITAIEQKSYKKLILGSFVLAQIFGPNLTLGLIASFMAFLFVISKFIYQKNFKQALISVLKLGLVNLFTIFLIAWWFIPNLFIAKTSSAEISGILNSESFYNLDTGVSNVLRNLGDWSFFSAHKGTAYVEYADHFSKNPIIILLGFIPLLTLLFCIIYLKNRNYKLPLIYAALSFLIGIFVIGGTNQEWVSSHIFNYVFTNFGQSQIFRNTYKFSIIPIVAFMICIYIFAQHITHRYDKKKVKVALMVVFLLPAFPVILNISVNPLNLVDRFPNYWTDMASYINKDTPENRTLLLPDQYFSVYSWDGETKSLNSGFEEALIKNPTIHNTCTGCANNESAALIKTLTTSYTDPNYTKLLNLVGVKSILQRNDFNSSFYGTATPDEINNSLRISSNISLDTEIGNLSYYKVEKSYDKIYAPGVIVASPDKDILSSLGNFNIDSGVAIVSPDLDKDRLGQLGAIDFQSLFYKNENISVNNSIATTKLDKLATNNSLKLSLDNPILMLNKSTPVEVSLSSSSSKLSFPVPKLYTDSAADNGKSDGYHLGGSVITPNYAATPDSGICRNVSKTPEHSTIILDDPELKTKALELSSSSTLGCSTIKLNNLEKNKDFLLWFDYRVIEGEYFGYCISYDGESCVKTDILKASDTKWHRYFVEFNSNREEDFSKSKIFFYSPALSEGYKNQVRYTNISGFVINKKPDITAELSNYQNTGSENIGYEISSSGNEIIPDENFSKDTWDLENKSCSLILETSSFATKKFSENGENGIELSSKDTTACTQSGVFNIENNSQYILEIDYKILDGKKFGYCVYTGSGCLSNEFIEPEKSNQWKKLTKIIQLPNPSKRDLSLYLYGSNEGENSKVQFKKASLKQIDGYGLPKISLTSQSKSNTNSLHIGIASASSPTSHKLDAALDQTGQATLVFLESFTPAWKLKINGQKINEKTHYKVNTFANAWTFEAESVCPLDKCQIDEQGRKKINIELYYEPQRVMLPALAISAVSYTAIATPVFIRLLSRLKKGKK